MSSSSLVLQQPTCAAASWPLTVSCSSASQQSLSTLWRPWLISSSDSLNSRSRTSDPSSDRKLQSFQHPVRLFWPRSKSFDYLYSDGEALLRNFPIQATISFYEESDSEEEEEMEEEEGSEECLKQQSHFTSYNWGGDSMTL